LSRYSPTRVWSRTPPTPQGICFLRTESRCSTVAPARPGGRGSGLAEHALEHHARITSIGSGVVGELQATVSCRQLKLRQQADERKSLVTSTTGGVSRPIGLAMI
jgi:hypothetical protein